MKTGNFDRVGSYMDGLVERKRLAGCSIQVKQEDELVYEHYTGYADVQEKIPVDEQTLYRIYSMTKPITVTAALQLYEQGAFLLNDPVSEYLPEFKEMQVCEKTEQGEYRLRPAEREIRIKDLFCMTSGMTYDGNSCPTELATGEFLQSLYRDFERESCPTREFVRRAAKIPLAFEPGTRWRYGISHDILGGLVEVISGERFGDYVQKHICEPLGMSDTAFHMEEEKLKRLASLYTYREGEIQPRTDIFQKNYTLRSLCESGGAGLISSLSDYMKFASALTRGGTSENGMRLLGEQTVKLMRRDHLGTRRNTMDWQVLSGYSYGLGVRTLVEPEEGGVNGSIGEFGWSGMAGSYVVMDPEKKLTIVYMQQLVPSTEEEIHPRLRNIVYGCL